MNGSSLPVGCFISIETSALQSLFDRLHELGYRVIGPTVAESAIIYNEIARIDDMPIGYCDDQDAASYRLRQPDRPENTAAYFDYVVGPHSLKNYLFPARATVLEIERKGESWQVSEPPAPPQPLAVIGVRSCDLHALAMQDRIFLQDAYVNTDYAQRRQGLFLVAVNCRRSVSTCFCTSMNTGPAVTEGFDLALTELPSRFVIEIGSEAGGRVAAALPWVPCSTREVADAQQVPRRTARDMEERRHHRPEGFQNGHGRHLDTNGIRELLLDNLEHERWDEVATRCLACGNCTMVCPTCFCSTVEEVTDLTGDHVRRERVWDCCFTADHSYMNSGTVRKSIKARYRQWLTHKLASWIDQFGSSGCVGCGRCITWCPVGIDLTEEVAAIRGALS